MDLALRDGVRGLRDQGGEAGVGLYLLIRLCGQVRGAPGQSLEAFHLRGLTGQVLGQTVQRGGLCGVGLRLHAEKLAAGVGADVVLGAVHLKGGQIGRAHVVAKDLADGLIVPCAGHDDRGVAGEVGAGGGA